MVKGRRDPAVTAYRNAVEKVPAASKARADAAAAAKGGTPLRFDNRGKPFAMLDGLPRPQLQQLEWMASERRAGSLAKLARDRMWSEMELIDVVEVKSGTVTHQLYVAPFGGAELFASNTTTSVGRVIQHSYQYTPGDLPLRRALAAAYATARPPISELIDFHLDEDPAPPPPEPPPSQEDADYEAAVAELKRALPRARDGIRLWDDLTNKQQATIRERVGSRFGDWYELRQLGIPKVPERMRWMQLATAGVFEKPAGKWPVWRWLAAAIAEEVPVVDAVAAISAVLSAGEASELCISAARDDDYGLFRRNQMHPRGESYANAYVVRVIRLYASVLDATGDDTALTFATRAQSTIKDGRPYWLGTIATFALAARAHRRHEAFPAQFFKLADDAGSFDHGTSLYKGDGWRTVVETVAPESREAFVAKYVGDFGTTTNDDGDEGEVPVMMAAWHVVDLIRSKATARRFVKAIATEWDGDPKPRAQVLEAIRTFGPLCVPYLDKAIVARPKSGWHSMLVAARKLFAEPAKPKASGAIRRRRK